VCASDVGVVVAALDVGVKAFDRAALRQIERLALRHAFHHVEQYDVTQTLQCGQMGERAADVASADECDLLASQANLPSQNRAALIMRAARERGRPTPVLP